MEVCILLMHAIDPLMANGHSPYTIEKDLRLLTRRWYNTKLNIPRLITNRLYHP